MRLNRLLLFALIIIAAACSKDEDNDKQILSGIYTETFPSSETHIINFINAKRLIIKPRNSREEEFLYVIRENSIELTPTRDLSQKWDLEIKIINDKKFELQNIFYASIPEDPDPLQFVTFEK